jgi:hypothetical protein
MMNQILQSLSDVPPTLVAGWTAWLVGGMLLMVWYRKAKASMDLAPVVSRAKTARPPSSVSSSAIRPATSARSSSDARPTPEPMPVHQQIPVVARPKPKATPIVVGDPFGELATLLDQPGAQETSSYRTPGDSPILNSAGEAMNRNNE